MSRTKRNPIAKKKFFRKPKSFQEIRENAGAILDGIAVRRSRKRKKPPTSWEDVNISASYEFPKNKVPMHWSRY